MARRPRKASGRGGGRPGAGRPRGPRAWVLHRERGPVPRHCPVHVTLRVRQDLPSLRRPALVREWRRSLAEANEREDFRVVHYAFGRDRLHLIVEARGREALANGMKAVAARLARAANRVWQRSGPVLDGRYAHGVLRSPSEVRKALAYVLAGVGREAAKPSGRGGPAPRTLDPASSARWFDGFGPKAAHATLETAPCEVARPRTWLLRSGWRSLGLLDPAEA